MYILNKKELKSRTIKVSVSVPINPLFFALQFEIHLFIYMLLELKIPLSYAAGHNNCTNDGICYLKIGQNLPEDVRDYFFSGGYTAQSKSECSAEYGLT